MFDFNFFEFKNGQIPICVCDNAYDTLSIHVHVFALFMAIEPTYSTKDPSNKQVMFGSNGCM